MWILFNVSWAGQKNCIGRTCCCRPVWLARSLVSILGACLHFTNDARLHWQRDLALFGLVVYIYIALRISACMCACACVGDNGVRQRWLVRLVQCAGRTCKVHPRMRKMRFVSCGVCCINKEKEKNKNASVFFFFSQFFFYSLEPLALLLFLLLLKDK